MKGKPKAVTVGSIWESNKFGIFKVLNINSSNDVTIEFVDTGFTVNTTFGEVRSGGIMDRIRPVICEFGFVGVGNFNSRTPDSRAYNTWIGIIRRCYDPYVINKGPTYKDCFVCDEWRNFQNFAEWFYEFHPGDGQYYHIDKDLKSIGNKTYSPEFCLFVSQNINSFTTGRSALRGECMIGVTKTTSGRFASRCRNTFTLNIENLGTFDNELEAHLAWRKRKSELAYELAMIQDREEVKQALLNWKEALDNKLIHPY